MNILDNIEIDMVSPTSRVEQIEEDEKEARIANRIAKCGSIFRRPSASNGRTLGVYRSSCKNWRAGCPRCLDSRANEFEARFLKCIRDTTVDNQEYLGIAQMSKKKVASIVKQMRDAGTEYWRVPVPDGNVILFFDSLHFPTLDNPELHDFTLSDWKEICQTPKGSRYSGNLGEEDKKEKSGIVVKIPQFRFESELDERIIDTAWSMALKDTDKLDPKYIVDDIEECLQTRMDSFEDAIESMGGTVVEKYRILAHVPEEYFGWQTERSNILGTIETKYPLNDADIPPGFVEIDYRKLKDELWPV